MALIYTVGGTIVPLMSFPGGTAVDILGPGKAITISGVIAVAGHLSVAVSSATASNSVDLFVLGFALMGTSGMLTFMCCFPVSFFFPERQGQVLTAMNCLFDASSVVFLPLEKLHSWQPHVFSRQHWFIGSACVGALLYIGLSLSWFRGHTAHFVALKSDSQALPPPATTLSPDGAQEVQVGEHCHTPLPPCSSNTHTVHPRRTSHHRKQP